jgi:hypothetical protein
MKAIIFFAIAVLTLLYTPLVYGQEDDSPKTEEKLIDNLLDCLRRKDSSSYVAMFPKFEMLLESVNDNKSQFYTEFTFLRQHLNALQQFDPAFNSEIGNSFRFLMDQGKRYNIHWSRIIRVRYELEKMKTTKDIYGYDKLAVNRLRGYVFIIDDQNQKKYTFSLSEIHNVKGHWYGGRLKYIFPAATKDAFLEKLNEVIANKGKIKRDSTDTEDSTLKVIDEVNAPKQRIILARKYYTGKFDNEISVKLYVRYLKVPGCNEEACAWEAAFKFGDEDYVRMKVSRNEKGGWLFSDEAVPGSMEMTLKNGVYSGTWTTNEDQTGYDAKLTEKELTPKKAEQLDEVLEEDIAPSKKIVKDDYY